MPANRVAVAHLSNRFSKSSFLFVDTSGDTTCVKFVSQGHSTSPHAYSLSGESEDQIEFMDVTTESDPSAALSVSPPVILHYSLVLPCCKNCCLASFSFWKLRDAVKILLENIEYNNSSTYLIFLQLLVPRMEKNGYSCWEEECKKTFMTILGVSEKRWRKPNLQVNEKSCRLRMATYRDGVKRKGDKIGMGV